MLTNDNFSYLTLRRKGTISIRKSKNQCKVEGHEGVYHYVIQCIVNQRLTELDDNGFLFDHNDLDFLVTNISFKGSCEEVHEQLFKEVQDFCKAEPINLIGYKATILPINTDGTPAPAYMEKTVVTDHSILPLFK